MEERDLLWRSAQVAWQAECRLDTLIGQLQHAGEYGEATLEWVRERQNDFGPIFEGLSEAAGILHAVLIEMERE